MDVLYPEANRLTLVLDENEARALQELLRYVGINGVHNELNRALRETLEAFAPLPSPLSAQRTGAFA